MVVLSHAYYQSGVVIDVPAIARRAHEAGALVVLDAYQTTGTYPYDVDALDVDVAAGGSHKWLCGGPGCGWMYVRPSLQPRFRPMVTGWFAHRAPFAFEPPPIDYADGPAALGDRHADDPGIRRRESRTRHRSRRRHRVRSARTTCASRRA